MRNTGNTTSTIEMVGGGLGVIGGLYLLASPFILGYDSIGKVTLTVHGAPVVQDASSAPIMTYIGGVIIVALSLFTLVTARMPQYNLYRLYAGIAMIVTGVVMMVQPYFSEYDGVAKPFNNLQLFGALTIVVIGFVTQAIYNRQQQKTS